MDFASIEAATYGDVENDEELMAELLALEADEKAKASKARAHAASKAPKTPKTVTNSKQFTAPDVAMKHAPSKGAGQLTPELLSQALKDIPDDELLTDDDEEIDDAELLDELSNLVASEKKDGKTSSPTKKHVKEQQQPVGAVDTAMLKRLQQLNTDYSAVLKTANAEGSSVKARRQAEYQRGINKIQELLKKVEAGKPIDEAEIPVAIPASAPPVQPKPTTLPPPIAPRKPSPPTTQKNASAADTPSGPPPPPPRKPVTPPVPSHKPPTTGSESSSSTTKLPTPPEQVLHAAEQNAQQPTTGSRKLDLNQIKSLLKTRRDAYINNAQLANSDGNKTAAYEYYTVAKQFDAAIEAVKNGEVTECDEDELPPAPTPYQAQKKAPIPSAPKTLLEGLQQRMEKYKSICDQCKHDNNDRKFRMNSRIVKQYEEAIRAVRAKRSVDLSELPCPPGYPPLPSVTASANKSPAGPGANTGPSPATAAVLERLRKANEVGPLAPTATATAGSGGQSRQSQQLEFLIKRQHLFKEAALAARKKGDMQTAKKYLLASKGFDKMIEASRAGLPVDIRKAPIPPQLQTSSQALKPALGTEKSLDVDQILKGNPKDIFATLEKDLIRQLKLCEENRLAFTKLGDVSRVKLFEEWSLNSKCDLMSLRQTFKTGAPLPRFRYENREFPSLDVCVDVNEEHLELRIVRVLNAKLPSGWQPSDGNIFVKYEFAFPHESHQSGKTKLVAGTNSPDFDEKVLLGIKRQSKQLLRIVRRNCLKFEVYQKGSFFRSDRLLGTAECKLATLEQKARVHESVDLMEGRRAAGGKIEFEVRIREPLGEKKLNVQREKWLILVT